MHYYDVELADFLTARNAEDEARARDAAPGPWHTNAESDEVVAVDEITVAEGFALSGPQVRATTAHIARHDPSRVLVDVTARRAIVENYRRQGQLSEREQQSSALRYSTAALGWACLQLAQPFADHPDFANRWRPL